MAKKTQRPYFVLYGAHGSLQEEVGMYDSCKYFKDDQSAQNFAFRHLPALVGKTPTTETLGQNYVVIGIRETPMVSMAEYAGTDKSYLASLTNSENLGKTIEKISQTQGVRRTFAGLELKFRGAE